MGSIFDTYLNPSASGIYVLLEDLNPPVFLSGATADNNQNGKIDHVTLHFDKPVTLSGALSNINI